MCIHIRFRWFRSCNQQIFVAASGIVVGFKLIWTITGFSIYRSFLMKPGFICQATSTYRTSEFGLLEIWIRTEEKLRAARVLKEFQLRKRNHGSFLTLVSKWEIVTRVGDYFEVCYRKVGKHRKVATSARGLWRKKCKHLAWSRTLEFHEHLGFQLSLLAKREDRFGGIKLWELLRRWQGSVCD